MPVATNVPSGISRKTDARSALHRRNRGSPYRGRTGPKARPILSHSRVSGGGDSAEETALPAIERFATFIPSGSVRNGDARADYIDGVGVVEARQIAFCFAIDEQIAEHAAHDLSAARARNGSD